MKGFTPFNINHQVKVKLNSIGLRELERQHRAMTAFGFKGKFTLPGIDNEGFSVFQLHDLMNTFGHLMVPGSKLPFDAVIYFKDTSEGKQ